MKKPKIWREKNTKILIRLTLILLTTNILQKNQKAKHCKIARILLLDRSSSITFLPSTLTLSFFYSQTVMISSRMATDLRVFTSSTHMGCTLSRCTASSMGRGCGRWYRGGSMEPQTSREAGSSTSEVGTLDIQCNLS